jgi:hypothetical protein
VDKVELRNLVSEVASFSFPRVSLQNWN